MLTYEDAYNPKKEDPAAAPTNADPPELARPNIIFSKSFLPSADVYTSLTDPGAASVSNPLNSPS